MEIINVQGDTTSGSVKHYNKVTRDEILEQLLAEDHSERTISICIVTLGSFALSTIIFLSILGVFP